MNITTQIKEKFWNDETGQAIPANRILPLEKAKEKAAYKLAKEALAINQKLAAFKENIAIECRAIYDEAMKDGKPGKGNFIFYNFDASLKIEVRVNENIDFDTAKIELAKQKLDEMISESINKDMDFVKDLVLSAFSTSHGKLDTKKVLGLKKHSERIKDQRYHDAMALIDQSIRRPTSKTYFVVWVRDQQGQYQNIDLNFSSI
jgi:hypothetical protein